MASEIRTITRKLRSNFLLIDTFFKDMAVPFLYSEACINDFGTKTILATNSLTISKATLINGSKSLYQLVENFIFRFF